MAVSFADITGQWPTIQQKIREDFELLDVTYATFIEPLRPYLLKNDQLYIAFPNDSNNAASSDFITMHLTKRFSVCFQIVLEELFHVFLTVHFMIEPVKNEQVLFKNKEEETAGLSAFPTARLNPEYTFDTFVRGNSNQFAHMAALSVAENPGKEFNPLFIYGGSGLGKTHLMNAIAGFIMNNDPGKTVLYITSEDFTNELVSSLRKRNQDSVSYFREKYRTVDVLLVDDIQFIIGKESSEEEFFHTFNYLYDNKKQIVLSSDKAPNTFENLEERLKSRFASGLAVGISFPDYETRMAILQSKDALAGYKIDNEILRYIANHIKTNIRNLEGALNKIHAFSKLHPNTLVTLDVAKEVLKDFINPDENRLTPEQIVTVVAEHYGIRPQDITSKKQSREFVFPRQVAIYLLRILQEDLTLKDIGIIVGGKHHTTVSYGYENISRLVSTDENVKNTIDVLKKKLKN